MVERSEASLLALAEPLARKFLEATTVDNILLVRNPAVAEARMRAFYPEGKIEAAGLSKFNSGGSPRDPRGISCRLPSDSRPGGKIHGLRGNPPGVQINWESWAAWSEHFLGEISNIEAACRPLYSRVTVSSGGLL